MSATGDLAETTLASFMTQGVTLDPLSLLFLSNLTKTTFPHTLSSCPASPDGSHMSSRLPWGHRSQCTEILCRTSARSTGPATTYVYLFVLNFKNMSVPITCNTASFPGLQLQKKNKSPQNPHLYVQGNTDASLYKSH